jgi:hypothetical protein
MCWSSSDGHVCRAVGGAVVAERGGEQVVGLLDLRELVADHSEGRERASPYAAVRSSVRASHRVCREPRAGEAIVAIDQFRLTASCRQRDCSTRQRRCG